MDTLLLSFDIVGPVDVSGLPVFCSLDTTEGSDCFGHWIHECATFLPKILKLKSYYPGIKILLRTKRRFKLNTLIDFGFQESDIAYSDTMVPASACKCYSWHGDMCLDRAHFLHGWVMPADTNCLTFIPHYTFTTATGISNTLFLENVKEVKSEYGVTQYAGPKTIPILYLIRSRKENYASPTARIFANLDGFVEMLQRHNVYILDIDTLSSLKEQAAIVMRAKIIIHEYGSATVNSTFFSNNAHTLVLNTFHQGESLIKLFDHLIKENGTIWETFVSKYSWQNIVIDLEAFEARLIELKALYQL